MKAVFLLVSFVLASVQMSQAQQSKKVYRIGYLSAGLATSKVTAWRHSAKHYGISITPRKKHRDRASLR
jgi:phage antirepressor YoqD-like protein